MTASVNILRGDLHLAVSTAFNRGRYVLTTAGGDGQPVEITIDLRERPDDLFQSEQVPVDDALFARLTGLEQPRREDIGKWKPFVTDDAEQNLRDNARRFERDQRERAARYSPEAFLTDDHGASVPAQGEHYREAVETGSETDADGVEWITREPGSRVYEFALQEAGINITLSNAQICDAPDLAAAEAADWVHVYDRVTRERRTLKRPTDDKVLQGLKDVAADLRRGPGKPVEPPFGCATLPPVGPLTSTEGLRVGDMVRIDYVSPEWCGFGPVTSIDENPPQILIGVMHPVMGDGGFDLKDIHFVGRPDADGWMTWAGGENPVPGATVEVRTAFKGEYKGKSESMNWSEMGGSGYRITEFRLIDTPPAV